MTTASHPVHLPFAPTARPDRETVFRPRPAMSRDRPTSGGPMGWWRLWVDSGAWRDSWTR